MTRIFEPASVSLSWYTPHELRKISSCEVTVPVSFDAFCHPIPDGLYDPRMGPLDSRQACQTCRQSYLNCPGHFGHIELSRPVVNPLLADSLLALLRAACLRCFSFKMTGHERLLHYTRLKALARGVLLTHPESFIENKTVEEVASRLNAMSGEEKNTRAVRSAIVREVLQRYGQKVRCPRCIKRSPKISFGHDLCFLCDTPLCLDMGGEADTADRSEAPSQAELTGVAGESATESAPYYADGCESSSAASTFSAASVLKSTSRRRGASALSSARRAALENRLVSAETVRTITERLFANEAALIDEFFGMKDCSPFFIEVLPVIPNRLRPPRYANGRVYENQANALLAQVMARSVAAESGAEHGAALQAAVLHYFDGSKAPHQVVGLRQVLEKKEGLFRRNIMGKRVNFAARSVISPDPSLHTREIGIPLVFAQNLTFPEKVTAFNVDRLRAAVVRGPSDYPGAAFVQSGSVLTSLRHVSRRARLALAKQLEDNEKIVWRHLLTGDPLLVNRQPTLHAVGLMAHTARVLGCSSYVPGTATAAAREKLIAPSTNFFTATEFQSAIDRNSGGTNAAERTLDVTRGCVIVNSAALSAPDGDPTVTNYDDGKKSLNGGTLSIPALKEADTLGGSGAESSYATRGSSVATERARLSDPGYSAGSRSTAASVNGASAKTLRIHYVNCKPYNADFDGDEMNIHMPQTQLARAEALVLAHNDQHYVLPSSGRPIRGLEQDHVVGAAVLGLRSTLLERDEYQWLISSLASLSRAEPLSGCGLSSVSRVRLRITRPAIIQPAPLYTGKQVLSTVMRTLGFEKLSYNGASRFVLSKKVGGAAADRGYDSAASDRHEATVRVRKGCLLTGILDKATLGASPRSLVHAAAEIYGSRAANGLLTAFSRVVNSYISLKGFTVRLDDLLLTEEADSYRRSCFEAAEEECVAMQSTGETISVAGAENPNKRISAAQNNRVKENEGDSVAAGGAARTRSAAVSTPAATEQRLQRLETSLRSAMNQATSSCLAVLEHGLLRPAPLNHMDLIIRTGAKGTIVNLSQITVCLGQQELEGKRPPVMLSGRTLPCFEAGEKSPTAGGFVYGRFLSGIDPASFYFHCMAGREGLIDTAVKTARSGYLQRCLVKHLENASVEYDLTVRACGRVLQFVYGEDGVDVRKTAYLPEKALFDDNSEAKTHIAALSVSGPPVLNEAVRNAIVSEREPGTRCSVVSSTTMASLHSTGIENEAESCSQQERFFRNRYRLATVDPGTSVGVLAAQSIGEPSTQMTLNTFHLAGVGSLNVTLGIPRLAEILMTASRNIRTPRTHVPLRAGRLARRDVQLELRAVEAFRQLRLEDCLRAVSVTESIVRCLGEYRKRIKIVFEVVENEEQVVGVLGSTLFLKEMERELRRRASACIITESTQSEASSTAFRQRNEHVENSDGKEASMQAVPRQEASESSDSDASSDPEDNTMLKEAEGMTKGDGIEGGGDLAEMYSEADDFAAGGLEDESGTETADFETRTENEDDGDGEMLPASARETLKKTGNEGRRLKDMSSVHNSLDVERLKTSIPEKSREIKEGSSGILKKVARGKYSLAIDFGPDFSVWMMPVVTAVCERVVVREVTGLRNAVWRDNGSTLVLEGADLLGLVDSCRCNNLSAYLDIERSYSNDIAALHRTLGVEAARETIVREMLAVFEPYGISIDIRHLYLVSDYMMRNGNFEPFSRNSFTADDSMFQRMSFESSFANLKASALYGDSDVLKGPSACITVGNRIKQGTGAFELLHRMDA